MTRDYGGPIVGDAWFGVDPVVDSQEKAPMGGSLCEKGEEDLTWKRIVREVEDGKSKWGTRLKEDWKELGVKPVGWWCNKVKDKGWLASKLGTNKKKGKAKKKIDSSAS